MNKKAANNGSLIKDMTKILPYDPGVLPTAHAPKKGSLIIIKVDGYPPYKDRHFSIRNSKHKIHKRFKLLRQNAVECMNGRAPYREAIGLDIIMYAPGFETPKSMLDYVGGIMDSLDGSHGVNFTYLPIVYEDDCQIASRTSQIVISNDTKYEIILKFL